MAKTVRVTSAQVNAAKLKVKRSAISGRFVSSGVKAIANAKRDTGSGGVAHSRSAVTGRYVTPESAVLKPTTAVAER